MLRERRGRRGDREDDLLDAVRLHESIEVGDRAGDRHVVQRAPAERRVVVDDDQRHQAERGRVLHLAEHRRAGGAGADDRDRCAVRAVPGAPEREQARLEAHEAEQERDEDRAGDEHRERDPLGAPGEPDEQDDAAAQAGREQAHRLVDARVAPGAAVAAPQRGEPELHDARDRQEHGEAVPVGRRDLEVEAGADEQEVDGEDDHQVEQGQREVAPHVDRGACNP